MEGAGRTKKRLYLTSYYKDSLLFFGSLLFGASQVLRFIQLFRDAAARRAANQAPPENYTAAGITWAAIIIVLIAAICFLLVRNRRGILRMAKSRACLLLSVLFTFWGMYHIITFIVEMARNAELTLLFDITALAAGVVAPVILLQVADITGRMADDTALLICGIGGTALSIVSVVMLVILRKGYSNAQLLLVTEFMFRIAIALLSLAALIKAIRLRNSYPLPIQAAPARELGKKKAAPARKRRTQEDEAFTLRFDSILGAYNDPEDRPKAKAQRQVDSLLRYAEQGFDDESQTAQRRRAQTDTVGSSRAVEAPMWDTGRVIVQGGTGRIPTQDPGTVPAERQTCPHCGKRMPLGFPNCPRCGRDM